MVLGLKEYNHFNFTKKSWKKLKVDESAAFYNNNGHWIDINIDYCTKNAHIF